MPSYFARFVGTVGIQHVELTVHDGNAFRQCSPQVTYGFESCEQDWILNGRRLIRLRESHAFPFRLGAGVTEDPPTVLRSWP